MSFIKDHAEGIMEMFFEACAQIGFTKCAFAEDSAEAVRIRYMDLLAKLRKSLVVVSAFTNSTTPTMPELVTYAKSQLLIRDVIYKALHDFPILAKIMDSQQHVTSCP